jgi:hypothetical protein
MSGYAAPMRWLAIAMLCACGTTPATSRALGQSDLSILLPLPADPSVPVLSQVDPLVQRDWFENFIITRGDLGPRNGTGFTYDQFQVVALRFDVCDRSIIGPCPAGVDGRLRLVVQPIQDINGTVQTVDVAGHLFYPIPAADLPEVISELRELAAIQNAPESDPLEVSPAAIAGNAEYLAKLKALVLAYARPDNLVRITTAGQIADDTPFAWNFRGLDWDGSEFVPLLIPEIDAYQQTTQVADGNIVYQTGLVADAPVGFALAIDGVDWLTATPANQMLSIDALAQVLNPTLNDAINTQCMACHVATYLMSKRSGDAGVDPATLPSTYHTTRNTNVGALGNTDARQIRAFGYVNATPIASQRVANDTAHALDDVEALFPAR